MDIKRDRYLNRLMALRHDGFVKIVTGIRRCGKSYLLFNLFKSRLLAEGVDRSHIVEVNLDDKESARLRNPNRLFDYVVKRLPQDGEWTYVFIDEVQMCRKVLVDGVKLKEVAPEDREDAYITFYDILASLMKKPQVDVYVTGSNSKMLSKDVATNFRDRGEEIRLHPLSFSEYLSASGLEDKSEALTYYLIWGGMPAAFIKTNEAARVEYLKGLFEKVYLKDIRERHKLKSTDICGRVMSALCSAVGSLTNPHKLVKTLASEGGAKTTDRTLGKYLNYFEESFLFSKAERYDVRGKKYLAYPAKYYCEDVGLRNAHLNFRETDEAHLMENVIYNELRARGYNVDVGVVEVWKTNKDGKRELRQYEIDFIVNTGINKVYIQSAYDMKRSGKREQETESLKSTGDFFRKIVVENGYRPPLPDEDGIVHVGVIPFLLDDTFLASIVDEAKRSPRVMVGEV